MRTGQFFIISAVLIAGALLTITTIITASETVDFNEVLERHDTAVVANVARVAESSWWDGDWDRRKVVTLEETAGAFLRNESVPIYLDARDRHVNDTCSDIRVIQDGERRPWVNTTPCGIDTYDSDAVGAAARYRMDEGSGTQANDSTGNGNHGTLNGDPQWVSGRFGNGLLFDGSGDYVEASTSGFDTPTFTAMLWARGPGTSQSTTRIINYGDSTANNGGFIIGEDSNGQVRAYVMTDSGSWTQFFSGTGLIDDGQWHHLAITYDGDNATLYVDGIERNTVSTTYDETPPNPTFTIGREAQGGEEWTGTVDDVRVYTSALSAGRIAGIAQNGIGLNVSVDLDPEERASDVQVYYDAFRPPHPNYDGSSMSATAGTPTVIDIGAARGQREVQTKLDEYVDDLDGAIGPSIDFLPRENRCDLIRFRATRTTLERQVC